MKKALLEFLIFLSFLKECLFLNERSKKRFAFVKLKLVLVLFSVCTSLWAQPPHTFIADGSVVIPAGITTMDIQAWGAGGAGGGAGNSGLLNGRSGGGGGGGAFAHGGITVNPLSGIPLSIKVAGAATGTTSTIVSGGSSTILGFESFILAAGGIGGTPNTGASGGGAPSGGAGGLGSASIGSISKASGVGGGSGNTILLGVLLTSGAGGTAGGSGGGVGAPSLSTALLGNGPGNNGGPPGGGGSGGLQTALNSPQVGGSGAHGQVIVTYTCPTYNITGISASNICISSPTSSVTVTGSAGSLPVGIYTVTYNRGTPAATGLTASMTVITADTGTFTAVGLTTAGTSSITVTGLTSGVCVSTITGITTNVIISPVTVQGSVGGGNAICNGATSAPLSLTGNIGSVIRWESSVAPFSAWTPIINTATTYTSGPLIETTQFRAVVQSGTCNALNSGVTTVTVNPLPQGSLSANGPFCASGTGQLTFTATTGTGPYTIIYNDGTANRTANSVVSGTAFATAVPTVLSTTTYTLVSVTDANGCIRSTGFTGSSATIIVNPLPQGSLTGNGPFCVSGTGQLIFNSTSGTGPYTIIYNDGTANRTVNSVVSGTAFATAVPTVLSTTTYTLVSVTDANGCIRSTGFTGSSATITVNPLPQGSLSANGPFCTSGTGQLIFNSTSGTGPYTIIYNDGTANRTANSVVSGTAFATAVPTVLSTTTYTLVSITDANGCIRSTGFTGSSATIIVNPLPQGSLTGNGPFCTSGTGQLIFNSTSGTGPYTIIYNDGTANRTANSVVSGTAFATAVPTVLSTTTYTLVSVTDANGCIRSTGFTGSSATIIVNPLPQGSLTGNGPFCTSGTGQLIFNSTSGTGPYIIIYNDGTANRTANSVVSGTAFATAVPTVLSTTTYTLVSVTDANGCIRSTGFTGSSATIIVNPLPQGSLTGNGPFCASGTGQLIFTATSGTGPYTIIYNDGTANRTANSVVSGTAFATAIPTVLSTTIYTLVSVTDANGCIRSTGFTGSSATIIVNPLPQGSLTGNGPFCTSGTGQLIFNSTSGTGPYTIIYNDGTANRTANSVVSGTAFATAVPTVLSTTTYTLVSVTDANGCIRSTGFTGSSATIIVNPLPQGSLTGNGPFCTSGTGQLIFNSTSGTGPYTVIYNDGTANRTANSVVSGTAFATAIPTVLSTTTYTLVSVTDANGCIRSTGFTGSSATITVNSLPIPVFSVQPGATVCVNNNVTYTTLAGQTNYVWTVPGIAGTDYDVVSGGISTTNNTVTLLWKTIGNKTVTVSYSSNGCAAVVNASNLTLVTKTLPGVVSGGSHICTGNPSPLLTLSGYSGTIVRWEYAESLPYVWQSISYTGSTYQPGILATSTSYRAVVKDGTCAEEFATETRIEIDARPSTPIPGTPVQPTCINAKGSIVLSGLLAVPNWTIIQTGSFPQTYTNSGTSFTVSNLVPGNYTFTIQDGANCPSLPTANIEIKAPDVNIWNGLTWSKGSAPVNTDSVEFAGNYETTGDLSACSCIIHPEVNVTVNSNHTLTIENALINNGGTLTFENNASLLQVNNAVNTGNITYKRNTSPVRRYDFTCWSSPVTRTPAFTLYNLSPNTLGDKYYRYNAITDSWVIIYNGNAPMVAGVGYIIRGPQNSDINIPSIYNASFEGIPNNGPVSVSLGAAEKWSLIGNPYPSAVYADQFIFDNSANLYGTLYFWTHNSLPSNAIDGGPKYYYTTDDYAIYNLTGSISVGNLTGEGATTPGNQNPPLGYIAAGQSFFAKSKTGLNAVFTNSMRVSGRNAQFFKNTNSNIERHRVWLNLTNTQGAFKQLLIGYVEGATNGWDTNYDGVSMDGNKYLDFYSINGDLKLVIQGRAVPFLDSDFVPLGYRSAIAGDFTIAIDHADGNLSTQPIYLEDKTTGITHDLRASNYTFTTAIGTFKDRFVLRYAKTLGVGNFEKFENDIVVFVKNKNIKITSPKETLKEVFIYDISGKMLYDRNKIGNTELQISNLQSGNQVLLIKVVLENGYITTKKVVF